METEKYTGEWRYATPDKWIQTDGHPKDELLEAEDNWPMWIWHECGTEKGYNMVCIESGRTGYSNYWAYSDGNFLETYHTNDHRSTYDKQYTRWYIKKQRDDGYVFLCNRFKSPGDPRNCKTGIKAYIHIPKSCVGYRRENCCYGIDDCTFQYTYGLKKTEGSKNTFNIGGELSRSFEAALDEVISIGGTGKLNLGYSREDWQSLEQYKQKTVTIKQDRNTCIWASFQTFGKKDDFTLVSSNYKQCDASVEFWQACE